MTDPMQDQRPDGAPELPDLDALQRLAEALLAERESYRALVEQHSGASGQKVGYVTRPASLAVALDRYRKETEPTTTLAWIAATRALVAERDALSRSLNQIQDERAESFRRLDVVVGGTGLTPYQPEIDILIEQRILALRHDLGQERDARRGAEAARDAAREEADKFCEALEAYSREVVQAAEAAYRAVCLHASDVPSVILRLGVEKDAARAETARLEAALREVRVALSMHIRPDDDDAPCDRCWELTTEARNGIAAIDATLTPTPPQPAARTEEGQMALHMAKFYQRAGDREALVRQDLTSDGRAFFVFLGHTSGRRRRIFKTDHVVRFDTLSGAIAEADAWCSPVTEEA